MKRTSYLLTGIAACAFGALFVAPAFAQSGSSITVTRGGRSARGSADSVLLPTDIVITTSVITNNEAPTRRRLRDGVPVTIKPADSASTDFLSDESFYTMPREQRRAMLRGAALKRFEPSGTASADRLPLYIERFKSMNVFNDRITLYNVTPKLVPGTTNTVELDGEVTHRTLSEGTADVLRELGFTVKANRIEVLPGPEVLGKRTERGSELPANAAPYAMATTNTATMRRSPKNDAEQVNSIAMGGPIRLLRRGRATDVTTETAGGGGGRGRGRRGGRGANQVSPPPEKWFLAQTAEAYVGFVREDEIVFRETWKLPTAMLIENTTVTLLDTAARVAPDTTFSDADPSTSGVQFMLHAGALLYSPTEQIVGGVTFTPAAFFEIPGICRVDAAGDNTERVRSFKGRAYEAADIVNTSRSFMGVGYTWGGVTSEGIDCSGYSQFVWRARGVFLPRDAAEQSIVGFVSGWGTDAPRTAEPGDLVFFVSGRGRVGHVAVSLGGSRIIHSQGPGMQVGDLTDSNSDEGDGSTMLDRVLYTRRILNP